MNRPNRVRLLLSPLWFFVALTTLIAGVIVSGNAAHGAETRVRAIPTVETIGVGINSSEAPASVGCLRPSPPGFASGSCVATNTSPTYGQLRGQPDAHHVIQDAAVRDVPGYSRSAAPAVRLDGPSTTPGTPHYNATQAQSSTSVGGTYGADRQVGACALAAAGCSPAVISDALQRADNYFMGELGLTMDSPLRIPGNRRGVG